MVAQLTDNQAKQALENARFARESSRHATPRAPARGLKTPANMLENYVFQHINIKKRPFHRIIIDFDKNHGFFVRIL